MGISSLRRLMFLAAPLLVLISAASAAINTSEEVELGRSLAREYKKMYPVSQDQALQDRVNRIGRRIVDTIKPAMYPYEFTVMAIPDINAFALPGGFMFFYEGLLREVTDDNALAYVIAHEVTHACHRHYAKREDKLALPAILGTLASIQIKDYNGYLAGLVVQLSALSYSREDERDADRTGLRMAWQAGYDPAKCADLFNVFVKLDKGDKTPKFLRSHPPSKDRLKHAQEMVGALALETRPTSAPDAAVSLDPPRIVGQLPAQPISANRYYPLAVGNEWVYAVSGGGGTTTFSVKVVGLIETPAGNVYRAETTIGETRVPCQLLTTESHLWRRPLAKTGSNPWRLDLMLNPTPEGLKEGDRRYLLVGLEEVNLACGRFSDCRHVRSEGETPETAVDMWFAPDVGLIKRVSAKGIVETLAKYRISPPKLQDGH